MTGRIVRIGRVSNLTEAERAIRDLERSLSMVARDDLAYVHVVDVLPDPATGPRLVLLGDTIYRNALDSYVASIASGNIVGQIVATQIADAAINTAHFAQGIEPVAVVNALPNHIGGPSLVFLTTDQKLYRNTGAGYVRSIPTADLDGQVLGTQIADAAITTAKFAAGIAAPEVVDVLPNPVGGPELVYLTTDKNLYRNQGTEYTAEIAANLVVGELIAGQIAAGAIGVDELAADAVRTQHIFAEAVTGVKIAALAIDTQHLAAEAVEAGKIAANAITSDTIEANAVIFGKVAAGAIRTDEIAADAILSHHIVSDQILSNHILANQILAGHILAGEIETAHMTAGSINADRLVALSITAGLIATDAIIARHIMTDQIVARHILAEAIESDKIKANAVTADKIAANAIANAGNTVGVLFKGALPGTWERYLNLTATLAEPFLYHPALQLLANGTATFSGALSAATGTFSGTLSGGSVVSGSGLYFATDGVASFSAVSGTGIDLYLWGNLRVRSWSELATAYIDTEPNSITLGGAVNVAGTLTINGTSVDSSTSDIAWTRITGEPDFTTRWPTFAEVTNKPTTFQDYGITGGTISGNTNIDGSLLIRGNYLTVSGAAGSYRQMGLYTTVDGTAVARWIIAAETAAESGSNNGSHFHIYRYSDAGDYLGTPLSIHRATGNVALEGALSTPSTVTAGYLFSHIWRATGTGNLQIENNAGTILAYFNPSTGVSYTQYGLHIGAANNGKLSFETGTRQMIDLYGTSYGIGVQGSTQYFRTGGGFAWYVGGAHNDTQWNSGGGTTSMTLDSTGTLGVNHLVSQATAVFWAGAVGFKDWTADTSYKMLSFNQNWSAESGVGIFGQPANPHLYFQTAASGAFSFRVANVERLNISASGVTIPNALAVDGEATFSGITNVYSDLYLNRGGIAGHVNFNRASGIVSTLKWYGYVGTWLEYMSPPGAGLGPNGTAAVAGNLVTSWAKRSAIEAVVGYGWIWETRDQLGAGTTIRAQLDYLGTMRLDGGLMSGASAYRYEAGDMGVSRNSAPTQGVIYFGDTGSKYIYYDGSSFNLVGGATNMASFSATGAGSVGTSLSVGTTAIIGGQAQADTYIDGNNNTMAAVIVSGSTPSGTAKPGTLWCTI